MGEGKSVSAVKWAKGQAANWIVESQHAKNQLMQ
jgi:hypothetical protein